MKLQYYEGKGKGQPDLPSTNRNGLVRDTGNNSSTENSDQNTINVYLMLTDYSDWESLTDTYLFEELIVELHKPVVS